MTASILGKADLHIHSTASDGSCEPEELVRLAVKKRLDTIAITDHDTLEGYLKAKPHAVEQGVRLLPGVEITTLVDQHPIHLLAYDFDAGVDGVRELMIRQKRARVRRMKQILDMLRERKAIDVSMDEVNAQARGGNIGRPHLAKVLVRKKVVGTISEAFIRHLGVAEIRDIGTDFAPLDEVVSVIRAAGGVTILAHPGPFLSSHQIRHLVSRGVDGLECIHPSHGFDMQKKLITYAEENHLLITGGSDYHGNGEEYAPWFGILTLGEKRVASLQRMAENRKQLNMNHADI